MAARQEIAPATGMVSRWRRRRMCILIAGAPAPAALREVSAAGAFLETNLRPALGQAVELHHPEAGAIRALVSGLATDGVMLRFDRGAAASAFALVAIGADMSKPD